MIADQAARLREMVRQRGGACAAGEQEKPAHTRTRRSRVIAVTSGKGGVGKTSLAVNLGILWAQMGKRVVLLDLDLGLANVDVMLNIRPRYNLSHVVMGKLRMKEVLTYCGGMGIVPGSSGIPAVANLDRVGCDRLIEGFAELENQADIIILDTAAGVGTGVVEFLSAADEVLVVVTPEPTSVVDAYAVVKMLSRHPGSGRVNLVVNMARDRAEGLRVSGGIIEVTRRFLARPVRALGYIPTDEHVAESVRLRQPFVLNCPGAQASRAVRGIGRMMVDDAYRNARTSEGFLRKMLGLLKGTGATEKAR